MKTPAQIARETVTRVAALDAQMLSGQDACTIAATTVTVDRAERERDFSVSRIIDAWEAFDGDDVSVFTHAWNTYLAGRDEPCPEAADGLHQPTSGFCNLCWGQRFERFDDEFLDATRRLGQAQDLIHELTLAALPETAQNLIKISRALIGPDVEDVDAEYIRAQAEIIADTTEPIPGLEDGEARKEFILAEITRKDAA